MGRRPLPKTKKNPSSNKVVRKIHSQSLQVREEFHQGPVPPPQILKEYDNVVPGAAEKIFSMAERQANHRQDLEKIAVKSGSRDSLLGLIFGLVIGLGYAGGAVLCILNGYQVAGAFVGSTSVASLAAVFVYGSKQKKEERAGKFKVN